VRRVCVCVCVSVSSRGLGGLAAWEQTTPVASSLSSSASFEPQDLTPLPPPYPSTHTHTHTHTHTFIHMHGSQGAPARAVGTVAGGSGDGGAGAGGGAALAALEWRARRRGADGDGQRGRRQVRACQEGAGWFVGLVKRREGAGGLTPMICPLCVTTRTKTGRCRRAWSSSGRGTLLGPLDPSSLLACCCLLRDGKRGEGEDGG
jgi:hypothetical protein